LRSQLLLHDCSGDFEDYPHVRVRTLKRVNLISAEILWVGGLSHHKKGILDGPEGNGTHVLRFLQVGYCYQDYQPSEQELRR